MRVTAVQVRRRNGAIAYAPIVEYADGSRLRAGGLYRTAEAAKQAAQAAQLDWMAGESRPVAVEN